jgi:hypothetical protein
MSKKTDVVEAENNLPISADFMNEMSSDAGSGFEGVTSADIAIPYYGILQAMSPQVKRGPQQIIGAKEGDIFNTVSQEVVAGDAGIIVIPCVFQRAFVEWVPRNKGGGFVKQHSDESILQETVEDEKKNKVLPNGNHIVQTAYHYIVRVKENGNIERAIISMTSTQLKMSRRWLAQQMSIQLKVNDKTFNPPPFSHTYLMRSTLQQKDQFVWSGWDISNAQLIHDKLIYDLAKSFANDIKAGLVKVAPPPEETNATQENEHEAF